MPPCARHVSPSSFAAREQKLADYRSKYFSPVTQKVESYQNSSAKKPRKFASKRSYYDNSSSSDEEEIRATPTRGAYNR